MTLVQRASLDAASATSSRRATEVLDVLVVGGGQAGLATAYHLRSTGLRYEVLERHARVGDSWRTRYDSLTLFTPRAHSALPGLKLTGDPNGYPGKDEIADYLEAYAARFELPIRLGVDVRALERVDDRFVATLGDGATVEARAVVIAAGANQLPSIPAIASGFSSEVQQLSSETYRNPADVKDGTVLVVGDGATGRQVAHELASGHRVLLSHGRSRRVTRDRILGKSIFWWLDRLGFLRASRGSAIGRRLRRADPFPGRGHDDPQLVRAGIQLVPRLVEARAETARFENGVEEQIAAVVWTAGYHDDSRWVHIPGVADSKGTFIESNGASLVPGLFFVGRSWQTTRGSALLLGVGRDAATIAQSVRRSMSTPRLDEQRAPSGIVHSGDGAAGEASPTVADRPPAARRWLEAAIRTAAAPTGDGPGPTRLRVQGSICRAPGGRWMDWEGRQSFESDGLGFRWQARLRLGRLAWVDAEDRLDGEGGYGGARLLGIFPVGSARDPEVTRSQLVRYLAELAFAPLVASRARGLVWSADGEDAFTLTAPGIDANAIVRFVVDAAGDIRSARSPDRPRDHGRAGYLHEPYRLDFDRHERLSSGERIPLSASGTFETADGDWTYWRFDVLDGG